MGGRLHPAVGVGRQHVRHTLVDLEAGDTVLVALSGGADSTALAAVTAFVARAAALRAGAVVVDHRLQPGSATTARRAAETARSLGLDPVSVEAADVGGPGGPEAAARTARYAVLRAAAQRESAAAVLLAHTRDDQAETVLLGLARGSGARSVAAMAAVDGLWRRPFLTSTRVQTQAICAASGLSWWEDPHNADPAYARVRVRTKALPALEEAIGPGVAAALARTADLLRADADLLDRLAETAHEAVTHSDGGLDAVALAREPAALRTRILRAAALAAGCPAADLAMVHVSELDRLVTDWHGQQRVELPGRVVATRSGEVISVARHP